MRASSTSRPPVLGAQPRSQRRFVISPEEDGFPDGMTVDGEDHPLSAHRDTELVVRYSPAGEEAVRVPVPSKRPTSLDFGGWTMETLFITSAGGDARETGGVLEGCVFALVTGAAWLSFVRGLLCVREEN